MENKPEGMEIEIFIHGAICFSYSGRCFLSDFLRGRSANYGSCAQSCRWSYNVYLEEKNNPGNMMPVEIEEHSTSILSSKDLCLINETILKPETSSGNWSPFPNSGWSSWTHQAQEPYTLVKRLHLPVISKIFLKIFLHGQFCFLPYFNQTPLYKNYKLKSKEKNYAIFFENGEKSFSYRGK